jgi:hypothetical protein
LQIARDRPGKRAKRRENGRFFAGQERGTGVALQRSNMRNASDLEARHGERGNVAIGYLVIAAIGIAIASALLGLGTALLQADQRAKAVLISNTP